MEGPDSDSVKVKELYESVKVTSLCHVLFLLFFLLLFFNLLSLLCRKLLK
jgi:hypothetical protein